MGALVIQGISPALLKREALEDHVDRMIAPSTCWTGIWTRNGRMVTTPNTIRLSVFDPPDQLVDPVLAGRLLIPKFGIDHA